MAQLRFSHAIEDIAAARAVLDDASFELQAASDARYEDRFPISALDFYIMSFV
jgi:hypothetical protein